MKIDILVAEIGSTTTVVNGFDDVKTLDPKFVGQGQAPTTVMEGDINIGLNNAIEDLKKNTGANNIEWNEFFASSSAAGGLKMTVHGLVYDMTVRAAQEAALGAGAIIKCVTAGKLRKSDLERITDIKPKIILIAGGVDYGERSTTLYNAEMIANLNLSVPVIYGGNIENHEEIKEIFEGTGQKLYLVENVYPRIDELNIEPARKVIQKAFEDHITEGPGMGNIRKIVSGPIMPTPGAVMEAALVLYEEIGDLLVLDVGGATTDVHSVTGGSDEIQKVLISPEPFAKRTVEGDLGLFVNLKSIIERVGRDKIIQEFGSDVVSIIDKPEPIPKTDFEKRFTEKMTSEAVVAAVDRHIGKMRFLYGPLGKKTITEGKDLTNIKWIIGTGGALTRLPHRVEIMKGLFSSFKDTDLYPKGDVKILTDEYYIMASLGMLSKKYKDAAVCLMKKSMGL